MIRPNAFQLHVGVFGNPGKGKSYLSGVLLEEARSWDIPCLVLDINGELIDAATALGGDVITLPDSKKFGLSLDQLNPWELVSIIPGVQAGTQYADLIEVAHHRLRTRHAGEVATVDTLKREIDEAAKDSSLTPITCATAKARVNALLSDPLFGSGYSFEDQLRRRGLILLDCRQLSVSQTRLIATAAARALQAIGQKMARKAAEGDTEAAQWFALYFVDEAHLVVPEDERVVSAQVHFELARMGRHVRTGLVLASQSPQDLNKSVLKRLQTRFVFALEKDQLRAIEGVLADLDQRLVAQLPKLPRGTCAVSGVSEIIRHGFLLDVRPRSTPVRGTTPPIFGSRQKKAPMGAA